MTRTAGPRPRRAWLVALVLAALTLTGCSGGDAGASGVAEGQGYVSADGSTVIIPPAERVTAPSLAGLPTLAGDTFDAATTDGKVVVLNVWASWCAPCRAEAPVLQQIFEEKASDGVVLLGVNTRDEDNAARAFKDNFGLTFPSVIDRDGSAFLLGLSGTVPIYTPTTIVLDRQGRVAAWALGEVDLSRLRGLIEPIVAEGDA